MADAGKEKSKKTLDNFAEDLDAMLDTDAAAVAQQVGLIDDDDAIDRLLMGDSFQQTVQEVEEDEFADIDALISADFGDERRVADLIDDFDAMELPAQIASITDLPERQVEELDEFAEAEDEFDQIDNFAEINTPELSALERVVASDEFFAVEDESVSMPETLEGQPDEIEMMAEIDEFSELPSIQNGNNADFLLADFDISADDDFAAEAEQAKPAQNAIMEEQAEKLILEPTLVEPLLQAEETTQPADVTIPAVEPVAVAAIDHSAELASLTAQINGLKKQQVIFKQEMTERVAKEELVNILEPLGDLETEQKKIKRSVEALSQKKPVAAYAANVLALIALTVGTGLGIQGYIAKSQVAELAGIIGKMQEQLNQAPTGQAADNALLRKELDALMVAGSVTANQIAELTKATQSDAASASGSTKSGGDLGKKITDLSNQNMQIGAELESLQNKVSVLEKSRVTVAAAPKEKPEPKKPPVVIENWAVNLIAFKQDWYAKRKAEEFAAKGVPAKVSKTETKGEVWYRLSVDGFKSQYEAAGYAAKVKKSLNLDAVWLTRIKD
jgi:hypothetical protein